MTITNGQGTIGRIYERLRKRSYRQLRELTYWMSSIERVTSGHAAFHRGYVAGLKDMANEIQKGQ